MSSRFLTLAGLASVAAIALAWSAFAAEDGGGDRGSDRERWSIPLPPPPGGAEGGRFEFHAAPPGAHGGERERGEVMPALPHPGPLGPDGDELTWGELHVQRDGEAVTLRVDHGKLAAVDSDSITVTENDGNDVEIPVDDGTEVMTGPFRPEGGIDDLEEGAEVHVVREEGQAAERIGVLPDFIVERRGE